MIKNPFRNTLMIYLFYFIFALVVLSISRLGLSIWQYERVSQEHGWFEIIIQGIRVDIATLCYLLFIPAIYTATFSNGKREHMGSNYLTRVWLTTVTCLLIFMELATPSFIGEYNVRPNRLFVEYLLYPKEVFGMLVKSKLPELVNSTVITVLAGYFTWKWVRSMQAKSDTNTDKTKLITVASIILIALLGARSSLGHRPLNPSMVYFTNDPLVNSLVLNSLYSVLWSSKELISEKDSSLDYGTMPREKVIDIVREFQGQTPLNDAFSELPTLIERQPSESGKQKNVVIILEESLGARFVGSLNGLPLTPNLDKLSKEGISFKRMFATGTRSVRGIEAVITGFTPTQDRAVVKLNKSQTDFFTIAEVFRRFNYHTEFIYGGEAHFDNMKSFFLGNGFEHITEQKDYIEPKFVGTWGVSDEDLLMTAHQKFESLSESKSPFFSLVFTSSNHDPFEFPDNKIRLYVKHKNTRNNAIKYADWALGKFFDLAKSSNYWKDTIFLIIADHDARNVGSELVPIKSFHIPAVILGHGINPHTEPRIVSQIDMPPTLLSMAGIKYTTPLIGKDLSSAGEEFKGRALLQNGQNFGVLTDERIDILQPNKSVESYKINWSDWTYDGRTQPPKKAAQKVLGLALWGKLAYEQQLYKLPQNN